MMKRHAFNIISTLICLSLVAILAMAAAGCGDNDAALRLVDEGDALRQSATDRLRLQTAGMDVLANAVAARKSVEAAALETAAGNAAAEYDTAISDLEARGAKLDQAAALELGDTFREYLALLSDSNGKLLVALEAAAEIPALMLAEQQVFSGWDEIRAADVLTQIKEIQERIDAAYQESETLRFRAEKLRDDNPGEFE
ncbi:MAG: hypothetical protein ACYC5A_07760 [Thermoleophilia bacterium]